MSSISRRPPLQTQSGGRWTERRPRFARPGRVWKKCRPRKPPPGQKTGGTLFNPRDLGEPFLGKKGFPQSPSQKLQQRGLDFASQNPARAFSGDVCVTLCLAAPFRASFFHLLTCSRPPSAGAWPGCAWPVLPKPPLPGCGSSGNKTLPCFPASPANPAGSGRRLYPRSPELAYRAAPPRHTVPEYHKRWPDRSGSPPNNYRWGKRLFPRSPGPA